MRLRGIIDRLDVADDGGLIVVDYKTGRAPSERFERGSMGGVQTYALLCESLLGRAPAEVRLLYLRQPIAISSVPSEQTIRGQRRRAVAVWSAIERACTPRTSGPTSAPCATTATSRAPAPPSPREEPAMSTIDQAVDAAFEPLRGRPEVDRAAAVVSNLADYGLIWVLLAGLKARRRGPDRRRAIVALATAGFTSLLVSRVVKAAVERQRPEDHLDASVRTPSSSSFPSGHTLAAFCTAFVLGDSEAGTAANVGFAAAVAASRVHLRAHHPTDVIGGAVIGSVLGLGLRPIVDVVTPGSGGRRGRRRRSRQGMRPAEVVLKEL